MCFTGQCPWEDTVSGACHRPIKEPCWLEQEDRDDDDPFSVYKEDKYTL